MPLRSNSFLILLAYMAMLGGQVFGLQRGYLCDCDGTEHITLMDHCHGHGLAACQQHEEENPFHHHDDPLPDEGDIHEHSPLLEDTNAAKVCLGSIDTPAAIWHVLNTVAWIVPQELPSFYLEQCSALPWPDPPALQRAWPQMLTHSIALRV